MRVLIVDDSPLMRVLLKDCLKDEGFEVFEAATSKEAELQISLYSPQIIFKDLYMPGWDAIDSIHFFKNLNDQVKIIICTTNNSKNGILDGLRAGAHDFLIKPFDKSQVLNVVKKLAFEPVQA